MIHHGSFLRHKDTESGSRIVRLGQIRLFWAVYSNTFNIKQKSFRNFAAAYHRMKEITIKNRNKTDVTDEALYALGQESFEAWKEQGLDAPWMHQTFAEFQESIRRVSMFVAQDAETGELLGMHSFRAYRRKGWCYGFRLAVAKSARREGIASRMLAYEAELIRKAGYRYLKEVTATTADWSVRWHLHNGFRIIGYYRLSRDNFANYVFRKQLVPVSLSSLADVRFVLRHPVYALYSSAVFCRLRFWLTYAIHLVKDSNGHDNVRA